MADANQGETTDVNEELPLATADENEKEDKTTTTRVRRRSREEELRLVTRNENDGARRSVRRRTRGAKRADTPSYTTPAPADLQIIAMQRSIQQLYIAFSTVSAMQRRFQSLLTQFAAAGNSTNNNEVEDFRARLNSMLVVLMRFLLELRRFQQQRSEEARQRALQLRAMQMRIQGSLQQLALENERLQQQLQNVQQGSQSELQDIRQNMLSGLEEVVGFLTADAQEFRASLQLKLEEAIEYLQKAYEERARNLDSRIQSVVKETQRLRAVNVDELADLVRIMLQRVSALETRSGDTVELDAKRELDEVKAEIETLKKKFREIQSQVNANQQKNAEVQAKSELREIERNSTLDQKLNVHNAAFFELAKKVEALNASNASSEDEMVNVNEQLQKITQELAQLRARFTEVPLEGELDNLRTEMSQLRSSTQRDETPDGGGGPDDGDGPGRSGGGDSSPSAGNGPCQFFNNITIKQYNGDDTKTGKKKVKKEEIAGAHNNINVTQNNKNRRSSTHCPRRRRKEKKTSGNLSDFKKTVNQFKLEAGILSSTMNTQVAAATRYAGRLEHLQGRLFEIRNALEEARAAGLTFQERIDGNATFNQLVSYLEELASILDTLEESQEDYRMKAEDLTVLAQSLEGMILSMQKGQSGTVRNQEKPQERVGVLNRFDRLFYGEPCTDPKDEQEPVSVLNRNGRFILGEPRTDTKDEQLVHLTQKQYNELFKQLDTLDKDQESVKGRFKEVLRMQRQRLYRNPKEEIDELDQLDDIEHDLFGPEHHDLISKTKQMIKETRKIKEDAQELRDLLKLRIPKVRKSDDI